MKTTTTATATATNTRLILFHQPPAKPPHSRLFLLFFLSFFTLAFLLTLLSSSSTTTTTTATTTTLTPSATPDIPSAITAALLRYAAANSSSTSPHLTLPELSAVAAALRPCSPSCNLLVFGITHEALLYVSLNYAGLTVFLDESEILATRLERDSPAGTRLEAYDVRYTTRVSQLRHLLHATREELAGECRPVQNLLFSECPIALNDLPNHIYDVPWDAILIDGPRGYNGDSPGRMATVFTAAVLARSKGSPGTTATTEVLVHESEREVERVCSEEFLCGENLVEKAGAMARFKVPKMEEGAPAFCRNRTTNTASFRNDE